MPTITVEALFWLKGRLGFPDDADAILTLSVGTGVTVGSVLAGLARDRPAFAEQVFEVGSGLPYDHVVVLLNRRAVELRDGMDTLLSAGDALLLMPGFAGG